MLIDGLVGVPLSKPGQPESGDLVARYLRGEHEEVWNLLRQSPLSIDPARFALGALEDWRADQPNIDPGLPIQLRLDLAPDALHKANTSGGPPYAVGLPFLGADPPFENEEHQLTFVEYLRLALRFAGFPGLELQMERADVQEFVRELTAGFVPF